MKLEEISLEDLRKTPYFHRVEPSRLKTLNDYTAWLVAILHNPCSIWEHEGEVVLLENKHLVARVNGLKIEIYSNEHPPPHFHVKSPNINASFDIENCSLLEGTISNKDKRKIKYWYNEAKPLLIETWNNARPSECTVGLI